MRNQDVRAIRFWTAVMTLALVAGCATTAPPRIAIDIPDTAYISPKNADGIKDTFSLPVSLVPDTKKVIYGYQIIVSDASCRLVRTIRKTI